MRKRMSGSLLALLLIIGMLSTTACSGNQTTSSVASGTAVSDEVDVADSSETDASSEEEVASAESGAESVTSKNPTASKNNSTATSSKSKGNIVYKLPTDKKTIFPNNWTATKNKADIPTNLKANVKSGKVSILTSGKMSDAEKEELSATYLKLTGKKLELTEKVVDWLSLTTNLQTMVMAKNAPDLFYIYNGSAMFLRNKGLTRNTNEYINMNDAVWKDMQDMSKYMFYDNKLTGVAVDQKIAMGFSYDKRQLGSLTDPWELYKKGEWTVDKFMEYVEKLTKRSGNNTSRYGVSMTSVGVLRMGLAMGEDIVTVKEDGSYGNNLKSTTWTRYAGYARKINDLGSMDPYTITDSGFGEGRCVFKESWWYAIAVGDAKTIALKKAGQVGWVPTPKDSRAKKYYHLVESNFYMLPANSNNPWGGAAYIYALRYQAENRDAKYANADKQRYLDAGYTAEEYEYFTNGIYKDITPIYCNWQNMPNFNYNDLQSCSTESWSTIVARANPKLETALAAQNR